MPIAGVIEAVGVIAGVVVYFVKSSLYENLLTKMLGRLALADVFTDITSNSERYSAIPDYRMWKDCTGSSYSGISG